MVIKVLWTKFAEDKLYDIFQYYKEVASLSIATKLVNGIVTKTIRLEKHPQLGQIEELLIQRIQEFRYLIFKNYKIIYYQDELTKNIVIVNVFDTRQNPVKIALDR